MRPRAGFTLIELTVVLTLAAAVVALGYRTVEFVSARYQAGNSRAEEIARQASARRELAQWIAGARVLPRAEGPAFEGVDAQSDAGADDELSFLTIAPTSIDPRYTVVRLFIDRDSATEERGLVAELRQWLGSDRQSFELEATVSTLDVSYVTGSENDRRRLGNWISASLLPRAVELRFGEQDESLADLFRVPLVVALEGAR